MPDKIYFHEFLVEAEDIVHSLSSNLLQMKSLPVPSGDSNPDIVNDIFRDIHTLKGISSTFGFTRLTTLSHRLEDLLGNLRLCRLKFSTQIIDTLFEGIDVLTRLLSDINERGQEDFEIISILDKIGQFEKVPLECEIGADQAEESINPDLINGLNEYEIHFLKAKIREGEFIYKIKAGFPVNTIDVEMEKLQNTLKKFGEIIAFTPASGFSNNDEILFDIIFASKEIKTGDNVNDIIEETIINIQEVEAYNLHGKNVSTQEEKLPGASAKSITKTVRVGIEKLDVLLNTVGEIFLLNDTLSQLIKEVKNESVRNKNTLNMGKASKQLYKRLTVLRNDLIEVRLVPISFLFDRLAGIVKKLCVELSKEIEIRANGGDTKLDKAMIEGLADPLMHIIRNAVDHGIEDEKTRRELGKPQRGTIELTASQRDSKIIIEIKDDGAGIDFKKIHAVALKRGLIHKDENPDEMELLKFLFSHGFSTRSDINEVSGRGVGLDVVAKNIGALGGMIDVETNYGIETKFSIILPLTLLIARALIVNDYGRNYAIPFNYISEILVLKDDSIKKTGIKEVFSIRGHFIPIVRLKDALAFIQETDMSGALTKEDENERDKNVPPIVDTYVDRRGFLTPPEGFSDEYMQDKKELSYRKEPKQYVIVVGLAEKRLGIVVDSIKSQREILIKPVNELLGFVPGIAGFTEIDSNSVVPVLDVGGIIEKCKV